MNCPDPFSLAFWEAPVGSIRSSRVGRPGDAPLRRRNTLGDRFCTSNQEAPRPPPQKHVFKAVLHKWHFFVITSPAEWNSFYNQRLAERLPAPTEAKINPCPGLIAPRKTSPRAPSLPIIPERIRGDSRGRDPFLGTAHNPGHDRASRPNPGRTASRLRRRLAIASRSASNPEFGR
jgi:hypothetical protein